MAGQPGHRQVPGIDTGDLHRHDPGLGVRPVSPATTSDEETYAPDRCRVPRRPGPDERIKFGLRGTDHDRSNFTVAQGPNWANTEPGTANTNPAWNGTTYPATSVATSAANSRAMYGSSTAASCKPGAIEHSNRDSAHLLPGHVQPEGKDQGSLRGR
jgi:hypothetical protein